MRFSLYEIQIKYYSLVELLSSSPLLLSNTLVLQVNAQAAPHGLLYDVELLPQPLHPTLQPISAGDHLLQITQVSIQSGNKFHKIQ